MSHFNISDIEFIQDISSEATEQLSGGSEQEVPELPLEVVNGKAKYPLIGLPKILPNGKAVFIPQPGATIIFE